MSEVKLLKGFGVGIASSPCWESSGPLRSRDEVSAIENGHLTYSKVSETLVGSLTSLITSTLNFCLDIEI